MPAPNGNSPVICQRRRKFVFLIGTQKPAIRLINQTPVPIIVIKLYITSSTINKNKTATLHFIIFGNHTKTFYRNSNLSRI